MSIDIAHRFVNFSMASFSSHVGFSNNLGSSAIEHTIVNCVAVLHHHQSS
jgi:hypothetical protein